MRKSSIILGLFLSFLVFISSCQLNKKATEEFKGFELATLENNAQGVQDVTVTEMFIDAIKEKKVDGNMNKAIAKLQRCYALDSKNAAIMYELGDAYLLEGRMDEAVDYLQKAVSRDPLNKWYESALVKALKSQGKYHEAVKIQENMVNQNPDNLTMMFDLSDLYLMENEPLKAIRIYDQIEVKIGVTESISVQKKNIYLKMNKVDKAVNELQKLIDENPENTSYIRLLIELYVALNNEAEVMRLYQLISEIDPNDGTAQLIMADYYFRKNMKEKSVELAKTAFTNSSLDVESKITYLLVNYLNTDQVEENKDIILELANILIQTHPESSRVYAFRGDVYNKLKETDKAIADYKEALKREKKMLLLWKIVISFDLEKAQFQSALDYSLEAIELFPTSAELYLYAGMAAIRTKDYKLAEENLLSGLDLVVKNKDLEHQFYVNLGEVYNCIKIYDKSDNYFEKALNLEPDETLTLNNYAYYLSLRKEKLDKAEAMSKKTLEKDPDSPAYLDTYGWILYLNGKYEDAAIYIKKALDKKPWDAEILEHYGDILFKQGDIDNAVIHWERAKIKGSISELLDKKIKDRKLYE